MNKTNISAIIFGIAIIMASYFLGNAYVNKGKKTGTISVTGLGKTDFTSDLIVWEGYFSKRSTDLKEAFHLLAADRIIVENYLTRKRINIKNVVFNSVDISNDTKQIYNGEGNYVGQEVIGVILRQSLKIESKEVAKVEEISRDITQLLNSGVQFYSESPRYYYTKLSDLKIEMISKATADANMRAEKIADNAGGELRELINAQMGIFQITGQNSDENYSWGGTFNTSSKNKTASITMKLKYKTK